MNVKLNVAENSRVIKLVLSGSGVRGATGAGVPDGATDGQISVYDATSEEWVPTTVLSGFNKFSLVAELPVTWDPDTVYLKPA